MVTAFSECCLKEAHVFVLKRPDPEITRYIFVINFFVFQIKCKQKDKSDHPAA